MSTATEDRRFMLVAVSALGPSFEKGQVLRWTELGATRAHEARLMTRFTDEGFSLPIARELLIEVEGPADSIQHALDTFPGIASVVATVLAVANNCAVSDLQTSFVIETSPRTTRRQHVDLLVNLQSGPPRITRRVRVEPTNAFFQALFASPEFEWLWPAVSHYSEAMAHYRPGRLLMSLEHLAIAAQRLEKVELHRRLRVGGVTEVQLAQILQKEFGLSEQPAIHKIGATLRRHAVFLGDEELARSIMDTSHDFEHGSRSLAELDKVAAEKIDAAMPVLRQAIVRLVALDPDAEQGLLGDGRNAPRDYAVTRGYTGYWHSFDANAETQDLAEVGATYPYLSWNPVITSNEPTADGPYTMWNDNGATHCAKGVQFTWEGWMLLAHPEVYKEMKYVVGEGTVTVPETSNPSAG